MTKWIFTSRLLLIQNTGKWSRENRNETQKFFFSFYCMISCYSFLLLSLSLSFHFISFLVWFMVTGATVLINKLIIEIFVLFYLKCFVCAYWILLCNLCIHCVYRWIYIDTEKATEWMITMLGIITMLLWPSFGIYVFFLQNLLLSIVCSFLFCFRSHLHLFIKMRLGFCLMFTVSFFFPGLLSCCLILFLHLE